MTDAQPNVAILPNHMKLGARPGRIPLDQLFWPLGVPEGISGKCLSDLSARDHLILFPRDTLHLRPTFGTRAKVSIMVLEPAAIHSQHMKLLRVTHRRFHRVLTCNEDLLQRIPNGVFFPFGGTWVPEWRDLDTAKTRMCSLIASAKRSEDGHVLRHEIVDWASAADIALDAMGGGYKPFADKAEGLAPYRFSVVIENVRERNYFTEKLIDALLCRTVPIYWGCPNIGDFIDTAPMILCESAGDIQAALHGMSEEQYDRHAAHFDAVQDKADHFGDFYRRAALAVLGTG